MIILTILVLGLIFGLLIFVHELGHFLMAKKSGMRVEEFGFGFPPRVVSFQKTAANKMAFRWGSKPHVGGTDTIYSINWIPFGGFVKILGENGENAEQDSFAAKSALKRFGVLIAGVSMNVVLTWILMSFAFMVGMPTSLEQGQTLPGPARTTDPKLTIMMVQKSTPAETAGLKWGDIILSINGSGFKDIQETQDYISKFAGQPLNFKIQRGNEILERNVMSRLRPPQGEGPAGIALGLVSKVSYPWYYAIYYGLVSTASILEQIVYAFYHLITSAFSSGAGVLAGSLTGPIGIAVLIHDATKLGLVSIIYLTAMLSANLAIVNALPFPALDGGRILFLLVEKIRKKKMHISVESYANMIGLFLLISLMLWVTVHDIGKFSGQFVSLWNKMTSIF